MKLIRRIVATLITMIIFTSSFGNVFAFESVCVLSDFENGLDGWKNDFECTMYRTNQESHSGKFSMETTVMNDYGCPKFHFRFIPGVKYRFSVWVKVKGASDVAQVIFDYSAYGQQQPWWGFFGVNTQVSSDGWTEIAFDYEYNGGNPTGDTNIFIRIGDGKVKDLASAERKTYYIDDLKISYQNPSYRYVGTQYSEAETAVNMGFDMNTDGYYSENARMRYVKDGCNNTYGAALVLTEHADGYVGQKYTVEEGKQYKLSAYIKSPERTIPFRYMVAESVNGKYRSRPLSDEFIVGDQWTKLTADYEIRDDESTNEKIFYILGGNGTDTIKYYLDEFSILKYDSDKEISYKDKNKFFSNPDGKLAFNAGAGNIQGVPNPYFENSELICRADLLAEAIGAEYSYLPDGSLMLTKGVNTLKVIPDSKIAYWNDIVKLQNNKPAYRDGRLMISANFVAETFGLETEFLKDYNLFCIDNDRMNGYLANTVKKLRANEKIKIAYFGSSFMRGADTDYPVVKPLKQRIINWFNENYPNVQTELIDAELNGTDSTLGLYRLDNDVLAYSPDLVFIDFSVCDFEMNTPEKSAKNLENIIRRVTEHKKDTDIVLFSSLSSKMADVYKTGKQPFLTKIYTDMARYYDVAFLDLGKALYEDYQQSGAALTDYFIHNMQLTEKSAALYGNYAAEFFADTIQNNNNLYSRKVKNAIFSQKNEYRMISTKAAEYTEGWSLGEASISSDQKGSSVQVRFSGTSIGLMWEVSPKSGAIEYKIDNGDWIYLDAYDELAYKYARLSYVILQDNLKDTEHLLTIRIAKKCNPRSMGSEITIDGFLEKR